MSSYSDEVLHPKNVGPGPRRGWRDFPAEYAAILSKTRHTLPVTLGPMSWNEARYAQRELHRFFDALRLASEGEAVELYKLTQRLRISCPRVDGKDKQHLVILQLNPLLR
jgi:hypothetical protein